MAIGHPTESAATPIAARAQEGRAASAAKESRMSGFGRHSLLSALLAGATLLGGLVAAGAGAAGAGAASGGPRPFGLACQSTEGVRYCPGDVDHRVATFD